MNTFLLDVSVLASNTNNKKVSSNMKDNMSFQKSFALQIWSSSHEQGDIVLNEDACQKNSFFFKYHRENYYNTNHRQTLQFSESK